MPQIDEEELQKHTLNLFAGDYERLRCLFPDIGAGAVVRRLVRSFLEKTEGNTSVDIDNVEVKI